jgi:cysteine desulfurase
MIYLDANATTQIADEVLETMLPWLGSKFHNASGSYAGAKEARQAIEKSRAQVADLIGAQEEEIVFTGGGTEAVNTAIQSLHNTTKEGHFVTSKIEHSAVLRCAESLDREVTLCDVSKEGRIDLENFRTNCQGAAFTSLMAANNETGVIQPWREAAEISHENGLPFFCDAIQAISKVNIDTTDIDLMAISAHKFHGPKGIGALFIKKGIRFEPLINGGGQEFGRRSGTENIAGIVGMGAAAELMKNKKLTSEARDTFENIVIASISGCIQNGDLIHRLPNTSHLSFEDCDSSGLLILLDELNLQCSAGSACMSGKQQPSHVQKAMGISDKLSKSSLRFSFSRFNTIDEAKQGADIVIRAVKKLRSVQSNSVGPVAIYHS